MTTERLRDLLHEQVADVTMTDLSAAAWRDGQRIRRRRSVAVVGGAAAAALAVTAGVSVLGDAPGRSPATISTAPPVSSEPDTTYAGAPVWVAPSLAEEARLPRLEGTGLPAEIDLSSGAPSAAGIDRAVGVLGVWPDGDLSRVVAVGADGGSYDVGIGGRLRGVRDEQGNVISAQSYFLADPVAVNDTTYTGLDAVVATQGGRPRLLVFAPLDERWKGCCPVVGWSDADHVLVESRTASARVLAWRVGSHDVRVVSRIVGWVAGEESYVASWSLLGL